MRILLLGLLLAGAVLSAQSFSYPPMLDGNHVWVYLEYARSDGPGFRDGFALTVGGDTTINDVTYRQLLRHPLAGTQNCPPEERPCYALETPYRVVGTPTVMALMREDTAARRVWRYNTSANDRYPAEYLIFDFALNAGDTLPETARSFHCDGFSGVDSCGVVTRTDGDQSLSNVPFPRVYHYGSVTRAGLVDLGEVSYTAARGYPTLGVLTLPDERVQLADFCGVSAEVCATLVSARPQPVTVDFTVYPNPMYGAIRIDAPLPVVGVQYYDGRGRSLPDLRRQPPGLYVVRVDFGDGRFGIRRVVRR